MEFVRALTLNIWNRQGPWERRRALILAGLSALSPDVIALQEVLRLLHDGPPMCQAEELARVLGLRVAYGPAWDVGREVAGGRPGMLFLGNALITRFPILATETFSLPNPERHETRSLLYALLQTPLGLLPVFTTHLDWQLHLSHVRCQQIRFVADRIREVCAALGADPSADVLPAILLGDLNAEPESDEIRFLRGLHPLPGADGAPARAVYYSDCFALAGQGPGATFARSNRYARREREPDRRRCHDAGGRMSRAVEKPQGPGHGDSQMDNAARCPLPHSPGGDEMDL